MSMSHVKIAKTAIGAMPIYPGSVAWSRIMRAIHLAYAEGYMACQADDELRSAIKYAPKNVASYQANGHED